MPASLDSVRREVTIEPTPKGSGLQMPLMIKAYDSGMIEVNGRPISQRLPGGGYDPGQSWLGASEFVTLCLSEFQRQAALRQAGDG